MSNKLENKQITRITIITLLVVSLIIVAYKTAQKSLSGSLDSIVLFIICIIIIGIIYIFIATIRDNDRRELLEEILSELSLESIDSLVQYDDDQVIVKSRKTLDNYTDLKYLKDNDTFEIVRERTEIKQSVYHRLDDFLAENDYKGRSQYNYVKNLLTDYMEEAADYRVKVTYITPAGNDRGTRRIHIGPSRVEELIEHPELLLTKGEYNKLLKQQTREKLDAKKHAMYARVNTIIDLANESKRFLIVKSQEKKIDELIQDLFDRTVNSIQKVSKIDSDEWSMLNSFITKIEDELREIVRNDKKISDYYESEEFTKIKETCNLLTQSQKEFNEYINEKAQSITQLFGTRVVRNETVTEDVFHYLRTYKKSITPFTAEVSAAVFGSAENNPISYVVKYFYPDKSKYKVQIEKLKMLIEELETLKEAKEIIDNHKKEFARYIQNVPAYVIENDENGFYSRLGLAIIDDNVLNVEYKFTYTSNGGMAQRSFTVPMNEENIALLIGKLENKLSLKALAKEQRALMTTKLRKQIKERDNYTCRQCGNSIFAEPNLLLEIDHIIPISKGGLTKESNLQTLCWKCNRKKGAAYVGLQPDEKALHSDARKTSLKTTKKQGMTTVVGYGREFELQMETGEIEKFIILNEGDNNEVETVVLANGNTTFNLKPITDLNGVHRLSPETEIAKMSCGSHEGETFECAGMEYTVKRIL